MKAAVLHRFTVGEYYRLVEIGVLRSRSPVELLDGEIYDLSPPAPCPAIHRFSVKDYYRMVETGLLTPDARVELLDGVICDMSPVGPFHGGVLNHLISIFSVAANGSWIVTAQNPVELSIFSEPQPDLMLLKPAPGYYKTHHPMPDDVLLLIEVADSTLATDRNRKLPVYARAGIVEVWIVNLPDQTIEIYREPHATGYEAKSILGSNDKASPAGFPDTIVDIAALFRT